LVEYELEVFLGTGGVLAYLGLRELELLLHTGVGGAAGLADEAAVEELRTNLGGTSHRAADSDQTAWQVAMIVYICISDSS
jgi:hypothetical protein